MSICDSFHQAMLFWQRDALPIKRLTHMSPWQLACQSAGDWQLPQLGCKQQRAGAGGGWHTVRTAHEVDRFYLPLQTQGGSRDRRSHTHWRCWFSFGFGEQTSPSCLVSDLIRTTEWFSAVQRITGNQIGQINYQFILMWFVLAESTDCASSSL